jgi:nucleoside-diphosphate-sugar epimerase
MTATNRMGPISTSEAEIDVPTAGQKNVVIVAATGMVGGYALRYALEHPIVGRVTTIGRRKVGISHPKLKEVLHQDFADCSALAEVLSDQHAAIFCLGAYTGVVPDTELRTITVDYTVEFARVLHGSNPAAAFAFLLASGFAITSSDTHTFTR